MGKEQIQGTVTGKGGSKRKADLGLKDSELDFIYALVLGKATTKTKNGGTINLSAQAVQGKFYGDEKVISEQLQQRGFIFNTVKCDDGSVMVSITGTKKENEDEVDIKNNEEYKFSHKDGNCYPSKNKGTYDSDDQDAYHRTYYFDKNFKIKKYKPEYLGDKDIYFVEVLDRVDGMSKFRLNENDRNKRYDRKLEFEGGYPLWKPFAFGEVKIPLFSGSREFNFKQAREAMADDLNERYPNHVPEFTADIVEEWMNDPKHEMTWEESPDGTLYKVPSLLHNNVYHKGGQNQFRGEANEVLLSGKTTKPNTQSNKQTSATRKGKGEKKQSKFTKPISK